MFLLFKLFTNVVQFYWIDGLFWGTNFDQNKTTNWIKKYHRKTKLKRLTTKRNISLIDPQTQLISGFYLRFAKSIKCFLGQKLMHFFLSFKNNEIIIFDYWLAQNKLILSSTLKSLLDSEKLKLLKIVPSWYLDLSQTGCNYYETK